MNYEFWYNWEYARAHNPTLMCIGTTGGYGAVRAQMRGHVKSGNKQYAEECFWSLIDQTIAETQYEARNSDEAWREMFNDWMYDIYTHPGKEYNEEIAHFVRPKWRTPMMRDTYMDLWPDDMCIPTLHGVRINLNNSFAKEYADYIKYIHTDQPFIDPMDAGHIY